MLPPATWYPDPSGRHEHRYWDGTQWTEHVADGGIAALDPLPVVTADEQVDGGVAADIAAVAMAATSTSDDAAEGGDRGEDQDRWRVGRGQRGRHPGRAPHPSPPDGAPQEGHDDDVADSPAEDPWREAAAAGFIMPSDAIASLGGARHAAGAPGGFVGLDLDGTDVGATEGVAQVDAGITVALRLDGPGLVAATRSIRRVMGTFDLERTVPRWSRRIVGEGTVSLVPDGRCTVVAAPGADRVLVRTDTFVATGGRASLEALGVATPVDALAIDGADWLAVTAPAGPTVAVVDGGRRLAAAHLVAWTGGLELVEEDGGVVLLRGHGSILVDGTLPG